MKLATIDRYCDVAELWNSTEMQNFRNTVNNEALMPYACRTCYQSSHANWNKPYAFKQINMSFAPKVGKMSSFRAVCTGLDCIHVLSSKT